MVAPLPTLKVGKTIKQSYACMYIYYRGCLIWVRQNDLIETDMNATEVPPLILIWLRHLNHILQRYDWDAKLSVDTNITDTPRPDLAPIWLRHPISNEYIYDCDAFYLWHTYDWDTSTRSCTHMTATPKIFFLIYILTQIWLRRSKLSFFDSTFDTNMTAKV